MTFIISQRLGRTALHMAADANRADCVSLLLDNGANINQVSLGGLTPLHVACRNGSVDAVKVLLSHALVDVNMETGDRLTAWTITEDEQVLKALEAFKINQG